MNRLSRDDFKKQKELEELRKTGSAPPELDEDGKMINPHIPQYISAAPWYLNQSRPGLKHQRMSHFEDGSTVRVAKFEDSYVRGEAARGPRAAKYQKDACENCGATTHKLKDCCERPRKRGAKLTGQNIASDDVVTDLKFDFEGKRDRWRGYDPTTYKKVIDLWEATEAERRARKQAELDEKFKREADPELKAKHKAEKREKRKAEKKARDEKLGLNKKRKFSMGMGDDVEAEGGGGGASGSDKDKDDSDSDTDTDTDDSESDNELKDDGQVIQKRDIKARTTVRNLRIREDTAKYLRNLNIHSAHYDPKTRSMRENPHPDKDPSTLLYAGDNYVRKSGDTAVIEDITQYVHQAHAKGNEDVNLLSNPSQAELLYEQFKQKKEALKEARKKAVLGKYGGEQHLDMPHPELLLAQSETYVEYAEDGRVIKGAEKAVPKTKYIEDVLENNHTEVWGSFWADGKWGYACCHGMLRSAYCTGSAGRTAQLEIKKDLERKMLAPPPPAKKPAASSSSSTAITVTTPAATPVKKAAAAEVDEDAEDDEKEGKKKGGSKKKADSGSDDDGDEDARAKARRLRREKLKKREGRRKSKRGDDSSSGDDERSKKSSSKSAKAKSAAGAAAPTDKSGFDSTYRDTPSDAQLDSYHKSKVAPFDPMAKLKLGADGLLPAT